MTVEADIKTVLDAYGSLDSLVSSRNYISGLPQNPTYPNTVSYRVSTEPHNTLGTRNSRTNARFQIECRASTAKLADEVAIQVIAAMEAATTFIALYLDKSILPYEPAIQNYRVNLEFSVWFTE